MILMNPDFATVFWRIDVGQVLTAQELAKYLKLTEVTIYKYAKEGKIPACRVGSRWRFDKDKVDELLKSEEKHGKE
jgi:excisionase family DNA binding protein